MSKGIGTVAKLLTVALKMLQKVLVCLPFTAVRSMVSCKLYKPCRQQSETAQAKQRSTLFRCSPRAA